MGKAVFEFLSNKMAARSLCFSIRTFSLICKWGGEGKGGFHHAFMQTGVVISKLAFFSSDDAIIKFMYLY